MEDANTDPSTVLFSRRTCSNTARGQPLYSDTKCYALKIYEMSCVLSGRYSVELLRFW